MKKLLLSTFVLSCLYSTGCKKNNDRQCSFAGKYSGTVQVIKDCTGTYIRYQEKDYQVCNEGLLKHYTDGVKATVRFNKVASCIDTPGYLCTMYHERDGFVEITCIR